MRYMASDTATDLKTIAVTGHKLSPKRMRIETAENEFVIGKDGSPLEYLLGSLAACIKVIGYLVADDMDITIDDLEISVEGDIDDGKYKGEKTEPRAGFQDLRVTVEVESGADEATLEAWLANVAERCPVNENLQHETPATVTVQKRE
jgi:uncharacterized OsmC-like protein